MAARRAFAFTCRRRCGASPDKACARQNAVALTPPICAVVNPARFPHPFSGIRARRFESLSTQPIKSARSTGRRKKTERSLASCWFRRPVQSRHATSGPGLPPGFDEATSSGATSAENSSLRAIRRVFADPMLTRPFDQSLVGKRTRRVLGQDVTDDGGGLSEHKAWKVAGARARGRLQPADAGSVLLHDPRSTACAVGTRSAPRL